MDNARELISRWVSWSPRAVAMALVVLLTGIVYASPVKAQSQGGTVAVFVQTNPTLSKPILVDAVGYTLYVNARDTNGVSTCTGGCAMIWPPAQSALMGAIPNLDSAATGTLSFITRDDGTQQLAYNGMPLYYYSKDMNPGDVTGQGVANVWSAATP